MSGSPEKNIYMCIDLKSFYASAECVQRGLDPFRTNLVVADPSRGRGAICLAVTPAMKARGVKNRCRVFEIPEDIPYITALPRMRLYMKISAQIYGIYLRYIAPEDIHVYSVDEVFIYASPYLKLYDSTPAELAKMLTQAVKDGTGITAAAGIGTNMFLAKVALDITAKHSPDFIGYLDEEKFRSTIQLHRPITDIWGIGRGTAKQLERFGAFTLKDVTLIPEESLYRTFGVNAEFLIDHAHGRETCTIKDIQQYEGKSKSLSNSQILFENYSRRDALLIVKEMTDSLVNELAASGYYTNHVSLRVGYSDDSLLPTGGSRKLDGYTDSYNVISKRLTDIYNYTTRYDAPIRKISISLGNLSCDCCREITFFSDAEREEREHTINRAVVGIKEKYGKNAVLRGMSYEPHATARTRNKLVGGHNGE